MSEGIFNDDLQVDPRLDALLSRALGHGALPRQQRQRHLERLGLAPRLGGSAGMWRAPVVVGRPPSSTAPQPVAPPIRRRHRQWLELGAAALAVLLVGTLLTITGVIVASVVSPGPNFVLVTSTSASVSRRAGLITGLGVATASCLWAALAVTGVGEEAVRRLQAAGALRVAGHLPAARQGCRRPQLTETQMIRSGRNVVRTDNFLNRPAVLTGGAHPVCVRAVWVARSWHPG